MKKISQLEILALFIFLLFGCEAGGVAVSGNSSAVADNRADISNQAVLNQNINQEAVLGEKVENPESDAPVVSDTIVIDTIDATPEPAPALAPVITPEPVPTQAPVPTPVPIAVPAPVPVVVPAPAPDPVVVVPAPAPAPKPAPAPVSNCDPNYTPCVPIASDVDCAGGSGNGPAYVEGPVTVIGRDIYRLDSDHDGIGCE